MACGQRHVFAAEKTLVMFRQGDHHETHNQKNSRDCRHDRNVC